MLPGWAYILIIIGVLLVCYFLLGFLFHFLMKKAKVKYMDELKKMNSYEEERGKRVLKSIDALRGRHFDFDQKTYDLIKRGSSSFLSLNYEEMARYKNTMDFTGLFLAKIHREDKRYSSLISDEEAKYFDDMRVDSEKAYEKYNKAARIYNVYQNMIFTRGIMLIKKEKKENALII